VFIAVVLGRGSILQIIRAAAGGVSRRRTAVRA
jgi:hypothetical protein